MSIDLEELAAVVRLLREAEFTEFKYSKGDVALVVRRGELAGPADPTESGEPAVAMGSDAPAAAPPPVSVPAPEPADSGSGAAQDPQEIDGFKVRAPLLGTFYAAPKPGEPPFVKVGDRVEPDTVVCIVEVMKLMNSVTAGASGVVAAIHVANGDLVEHGQSLFTLTETS